MMSKKKLSEKFFFLGIDGMDPDLTKKYMDEGKMPNVKKLVERGACRENLHMLGSVPNITPPMWTTVATGCNPNVHGITCFWNQNPERPDELIYAFNSALCRAEALWEVAAKSGVKTLVYAWPGSSWPPKVHNEFLHVVDGTTPSTVSMTTNSIDSEKMYIASKDFTENRYQKAIKVENGAGCVLSDVDVTDDNGMTLTEKSTNGNNLINYEMIFDDGEGSFEKMQIDMYQGPIAEAHDWGFELPEGAKEFVCGANKGLERRYCLVLKNARGVYDTVKWYRNKKADTPLAVLTREDYIKYGYVDTFMTDKGEQEGAGFVALLDLAEDGSYVRMYMGPIIDTRIADLYMPQSLHEEIIQKCGNIVSPTYTGGEYPDIVKKVVIPSWKNYMDWQAEVLNYLMEENDYRLVFSHLHNCDAMGHQFWHWSKDAKRNADYIHPEEYVGFIEKVYVDTDDYVGRFLHFLDEGWTIVLFSDHGFMANKEEEPPVLGDPFGINIPIMEELGYTVLKDPTERRSDKVEIDWSKTTAVASRGNNIYINLKGRYETGIVNPQDKYELEEKIIDDLYNYRDKATGRRIVYMCMRNKDGELVGMSGSDYGDIVYWLNEGFNRGHGDSLPTFNGVNNTAVSPIVIFAGKGIKKGVYTERAIREVDLAPTAAYLLGLRMPHECEGAPVYQIINE